VSPTRDVMLAQIRLRISDPGAFLPRGDNYTEPVPAWSARAVMAYVNAVLDKVCPTGCRPDCQATCHESHAEGWLRNHLPADCPSVRDKVYRGPKPPPVDLGDDPDGDIEGADYAVAAPCSGEAQTWI
jgi:hypothetical protein